MRMTPGRDTAPGFLVRWNERGKTGSVCCQKRSFPDVSLFFPCCLQGKQGRTLEVIMSMSRRFVLAGAALATASLLVPISTRPARAQRSDDADYEILLL
jgi:hypothetical protein